MNVEVRRVDVPLLTSSGGLFFHSTSPNDRKDLLVLFSLLWSAGINVPLFFPRRAVAALVSDGHFTLFSVPH